METTMGAMCDNIGGIARKNARLRDRTDQLVEAILSYSNKENINSSSKKGLYSFSNYLSCVENYRDTMVRV
jgi:hypothetical protein